MKSISRYRIPGSYFMRWFHTVGSLSVWSSGVSTVFSVVLLLFAGFSSATIVVDGINRIRGVEQHPGDAGGLA